MSMRVRVCGVGLFSTRTYPPFCLTIISSYELHMELHHAHYRQFLVMIYPEPRRACHPEGGSRGRPTLRFVSVDGLWGRKQLQ